MNSSRNHPIATYAMMAVCVLITVLLHLFPVGNNSESAIFYGAYYKPFILAGEWLRLFTAGFVHIEWFHLLSNMMSLYFLGIALEQYLGVRKYLLILFTSTIGGSLLLLAMSGNTVAVGLSGGLYGLLGCCTYMMVRNGIYKARELRGSLLRIFAINLLINFIPGVAWLAHLGGFVTGWIVSALLLSDTLALMKKRYAIAMVVWTAVLIAFSYQNRTIEDDEVYMGTDIRILTAYDNIGFHQHVLHMAENLDQLYNTDILVSAIQEE